MNLDDSPRGENDSTLLNYYFTWEARELGMQPFTISSGKEGGDVLTREEDMRIRDERYLTFFHKWKNKFEEELEQGLWWKDQEAA